MARSDHLEGQRDTCRRTPVRVELEDGGGAVMAPVKVDDGVHEGPDASLFILRRHLRDVDRHETPALR